MSKNLTLILDAAHGSDVPGKRSPDGTHREYIWSRNIICLLKPRLEALGYIVHLTVTEDTEPGLQERVKRANAFAGAKKLLISLHNNAAGSGMEWMNARGVEIYTTVGKTKSDACADIIMKRLKIDFPELKFRYDTSDGDLDKEINFTVLTGKSYMAVLLEWLFQDNKEDVALLKDDSMNEKLVNSLIAAVEQINTDVV